MDKDPFTDSPEESSGPGLNPLFRPAYLRSILAAAGFSPQKSRGQNFLIDRNRGEAIVAAAGLARSDAVLEIGPGPGALTRELCLRAGRVTAVERDRVLARILREETGDLANLEIVEEDFLAADLPELIRRLRAAAEPDARLKVVANLPYSVSGPILARLLESGAGFTRMVLTVQKEVGERIVSPPGGKRYGRLSLLARIYSRPEIIAAVSRNSFFPRPRVDSVVVRLEMIPVPELPALDRVFLRELIRAAFGKRRKMLKNALAGDRELGYSEPRIQAACAAAGIDPRSRPEELSAGDFINLAGHLKNQGEPDVEKEDRTR
jgi:16S rRNA (adenine1518-N6/adenine1519-N6)-dimethyltransferase